MSAIATALDEVAGVAQRLGVLLGAGLSPDRAWRFLAAPLGDEGAAEHPAAAAGGGALLSADAVSSIAARDPAGDHAAAIVRACEAASPFGLARHRVVAWRLFAAGWAVAVRSGAPLAVTLQSFAAALRRAAALHRELGVAFSGPRSTARLVGFLPLVALALGLLLGFDTLHVLVATPAGWACLAGGLCLMVAARRWSGRLLSAAEPRELVPGLEAELVAVAMSSGASALRARELVASVLDEFAPPMDQDSRGAEQRAIDAVLDLATSAGVPTVGLLRAEAEHRRADADASGRAAAASVAVRLMLPLAVCVLPAFMLLGVVPVLVALLGSTGIRFE